MELFIFSVGTVLVVSALCSLSEASLYAVAPTYVRQLTEQGSRQGRILTSFKQDMGRPITAILILNTVANTAGATVAGAQARMLFGENALVWFSILFTGSVLIFSEILPKVIGVGYNRAVSRALSGPLNLLINMMFPLVWIMQRFARFLPTGGQPVAPEAEVHQMAQLSAAEGSILQSEAELVKNVLKLDEIKARDIMTPRPVVYKCAGDMAVKDLSKEAWSLPYARIPIHDPDDADNWTGIVLRRDILACLGRDQFDATLGSLAKPLGFVPETMAGNRLLNEFLKKRKHLFGVIDEYGNIIGIVTLEDVLESVIGEEIVDETDRVVDMREAARRHSKQQFGDAVPEPEHERDRDSAPRNGDSDPETVDS